MKSHRGFSLIELLIVVAIILTIAAIAIPNLLRSRMSAQEAAAATTMRNIGNSQAAFIASYGAVGYATSLQQLGPGAPCDQTHACLVDELVGCASAPCIKGGYEYYLISATPADYTATATPRSWAISGSQNYCSIEDGTIRHQLNPPDKLTAAVAHSVCADIAQYQAISN
jgi:type IV pilus assembly protein PilA